MRSLFVALFALVACVAVALSGPTVQRAAANPGGVYTLTLKGNIPNGNGLTHVKFQYNGCAPGTNHLGADLSTGCYCDASGNFSTTIDITSWNYARVTGIEAWQSGSPSGKLYLGYGDTYGNRYANYEYTYQYGYPPLSIEPSFRQNFTLDFGTMSVAWTGTDNGGF